MQKLPLLDLYIEQTRTQLLPATSLCGRLHSIYYLWVLSSQALSPSFTHTI